MKLLNEILGTKYPIIQGGMANIATGEFAAACSNAGALGLIGAGGMNAETLRENIRRCKALTDKPFGVNIMLMHPQADEFAKIVVEEGVKVVTTGAGNPGKYISMWKEAGIKVIPVVAAAVLAKHLVPLGVDAVIAEGTESGGHVGEMTTMALVPQVVDSVTTLINNAESYYRKVYRWANDLLESDSGIGVWLAGLITERYTDGMAFLTDKVLPWAQKAIVPLTNGIWSGIRGAVGFAFDLIVGIIVSIYLMGMKEKSLARCCKAVYAALPEENADAVMRGTRRVNAIFSGFVRGKLLDLSLIHI